MLFNEASDKFLNYIKVTKANGTYRFQKDKVSILKRYLGNYDPKSINNEVVLKFILDQLIGIQIFKKGSSRITNLTKRIPVPPFTLK